MTPDAQEELALVMLASRLGRQMVQLERKAVRTTDREESELLWSDREAIMARRSEVLRQLWMRQRKYVRA